jgi:photosynthetic reaction center cytochrome c subunit
MRTTMLRLGAVLAGAALLSACQLGTKTSQQYGYRGTGMDQVRLVSETKKVDPINVVPPPPYDPPPPGGRPAREAYQNVQVLGDVSEDQFSYTMAAITQWIAPEQGCNYCHNPANMASDEIYTKVVARRMLQMTRNINTGWTSHVKQTGVTCYTCHRGQAVPTANWSIPAVGNPNTIIGNRRGQNSPMINTAYSSLPNTAMAKYLLNPESPAIRVNSKGSHPSAANKTSVMEAESAYSLMMHTGTALGVNCTFCHNADSLQSWNRSTPKRALAWYGYQMVKDVNGNYITPLTKVFPKHRLGPMGDPLKVNCTTCHRGINKPLGGVSMVKDYPALRPTGPMVTAAAAPAPAGLAPAAAPTKNP